MKVVVCKVCGSPDLMVEINIKIIAPLVAKTGAVKLAHMKFGQPNIKDAWETDGSTGEKRVVRGPVVCPVCTARYTYTMKSSDPLTRI